MSATIYTAITFAPVQGFIEKSRKLRDLYGSSFILSYLASTICWEARCQGCEVISPALINVIQGTPNQIIVRGNFSEDAAQGALNWAWQKVTERCRTWIEANCQAWIQAQLVDWAVKDNWHQKPTSKTLPWGRDWKLWSNHSWEFFWAQGKSITAARQNLNEKKRSRNWTAVNWTGESSSLSGADAVAYPGMSRVPPKKWDYRREKEAIESFYRVLSEKVGTAFLEYVAERLKQASTPELRKELVDRYGTGFLEFVQTTLPKLNQYDKQELAIKYGAPIVDPAEELSIPELVKRLVTLEAIAQPIGIGFKEVPETFRELNRLSQKKDKNTKGKQQPVIEPDSRWMGWFQGDGDRAGEYLQSLVKFATFCIKFFFYRPTSLEFLWLSITNSESQALNVFSHAMLKWGECHLKTSLPPATGRIIYAGGDDFLGVFHRPSPDPRFLKPLLNYLVDKQTQRHPEPASLEKLREQIIDQGLHKNISIPESVRRGWKNIIEETEHPSELDSHLGYAGLSRQEAAVLFSQPVLQPQECLEWFYHFRSTQDQDIWSLHKQPITVSVGFVWAAPNVPQRDILQHCKDAEQTAKRKGRDRLCIRILFNGGNYLEWVCPWWFLGVLKAYCDRNQKTGKEAIWRHLYEDVAVLESRHAFSQQTEVALALFAIYFGEQRRQELVEHLWDTEEKAGILDNQPLAKESANEKALNQWIINLAKVGFHLCQQ
ncbi:MAG: type III-B CRISPR-associated protein Cas10/Cmr2 [Cyanophyceae cyanobacterium]